MQWRVVKMGSVFFDALHSYGVAIVLATLTKQPVLLQNAGLSYEVSSPVQTLPEASVDLLNDLLPLPTEGACKRARNGSPEGLPMTILDGLLAALLTNPRAPQVAALQDLFHAQCFQPLAIAQGLHKVAAKIQDWKRWLNQTAQNAENWVTDMLGDYTWHAPMAPVLFAGQSKHDLHVPMTLDPNFAYSFHQAIHTGDLTQKTNVAIHGTSYAALLAFLGAARFLRSCSVASPYLLFVVPIMERGRIEAETSLPCLLPEPVSPDLALVRHWLAAFTRPVCPEIQWHGLAYQTLQRQKRQQPLCWESGHLAFSWLRQVEREAGADVLAFWRHCLHRGDPDEQATLVDVLKQQHLASWYRHLTQRTVWLLIDPAPMLRAYRFEEVRTLTAMLDPTASHPLHAVLERRNAGTVRFGHALRLLGRVRPDLRRELLGLLEPVNTEEELFSVLTRIVQACADAKIEERYILVPTDDDFPLLLDDIHQHGLRPIIGVLLVLSALHYASAAEDLRKYELGTLIRALLVLVTAASRQRSQQNEEISCSIEPLLAEETLLLLSQEEPDEPRE